MYSHLLRDLSTGYVDKTAHTRVSIFLSLSKLQKNIPIMLT